MNRLRNKKLLESVLKKGNGRCWYCGIKLNINSRYDVNKTTYVIDHFVPKSAGGTSDLSNLVPSCWSCNSMKRNDSIDDFRKRMTRLNNNAPKFTDEQLHYLQKNKLFLPVYIPHMFYFEREGLQ